MLSEQLDKLADKSAKAFYNPFIEFDWPAQIDTNSYWMSPELLTVYNTKFEKELSEEQLIKLSQLEAVHFFSLNIFGIKELMTSVIDAIHTSEFKDASRYFHHFIGEENVHMWFFSEFCNRYGGKIYVSMDSRFKSDEPKEIFDLITFSRIYVFERMVAYFNKYMKDDARLDPIIQKINMVHFNEESRHIAMGEAVIKEWVERVTDKYGVDRLDSVGKYLKEYAQYCVSSLYNPAVYRDLGLVDAYSIRRALLADPARQEFNEMLIDQGIRYIERLGL